MRGPFFIFAEEQGPTRSVGVPGKPHAERGGTRKALSEWGTG